MLLMNAKNLLHKIFVFIGFVLLALASDGSGAIAQGKLLKAQNKPGKYLSENKEFQFELSVSSMGGFLILSAGPVNQKTKIKIDDVSGVVWLSENEIIYSVSPIYGHPGVYLFDCRTGTVKILIKPETIDQHYPDGADYFELKGFSENKEEIVFYYSKDVDKTDFKNFRNKNNLRRFKIDH